MTNEQADLMRRLLLLVQHYAEPAASGTGHMHDFTQRAIADALKTLDNHEKAPK